MDSASKGSTVDSASKESAVDSASKGSAEDSASKGSAVDMSVINFKQSQEVLALLITTHKHAYL